MPLFLSNEEFERCSGNASLVAEKADSFIRDLHRQLETVKAQADASSITAEQTCALLEQKYISLSSDFSKLEAQNAQHSAILEQRLSELAEAKAEKHQLHLQTMSLDGDVERLKVEVAEQHKSKRQLLDLVEQKNIEISEKNALIKSYLDKIVNLTDSAASKEARLQDRDTELARSQATCARLLQEKELIERHNVWLNDELTAKVNNLIELRRKHAEFEADVPAKLAQVEREFSECSKSLKWNKDRVRELEVKLTSAQEELCSSKDATAANEERFSSELSTVTKLVELYKESADEWSKKAGELEGVIKALEMHSNQVENDYKENLEKEASTRKEFEKVAIDLKEKLQKCEIQIENARKASELSLVPLSSFQSDSISSSKEIWFSEAEIDGSKEDSHMLVPKVPLGISGTALAASLLRDGWSLAKMYGKYQETVDALRHEQLGRKHSEMILERVLYEIQEKAEIILDERAEHERMVEAYNLMNQKLQQSLYEHANLESTIRELKADLRRHERDYDLAQKEIGDLQKQAVVLLKECRDIQVRYGAGSQVYPDDYASTCAVNVGDETDTEKVISEHLLTFKDINGLVEQNVKLRSLVRSLSNQIDQRDTVLKENFEEELQKHKDEAASKVEAVLKRLEEQGRMIESLHSSVAMYKRLYEEQLKVPPSLPHSAELGSDDGRKDLMVLFEGSQETSKKAYEQATERARNLEDDLTKSRSEVMALRLERDKLAMEAKFSRERLDSLMKEFEHQREEINGVLARNVEFSQMIVDYQRRLRESVVSSSASEELSRKLSMEVSVLKHEKDLLVNSEKRALDEVGSLSQRVHRLQASLDTIQSAQEVHEDARVMERRKQEEYLNHLEREWAEAKKELQEERDHVRTLTLDREQTLRNAMEKVEEVAKKLADASHACSAAEARATVAEARCSELEAKLKVSVKKIDGQDGGYEHSISSANEAVMDLQRAKEQIEKLKEESQANKDHMIQYKEIANVNEAALKQMESVHEKFKSESDKFAKTLEAEVQSLRARVSELENDSMSKRIETASAVAEKDEALSSALAEIERLKEENYVKLSHIAGMEMQITSLKEDVVKEHQLFVSAHNNYQRQVMMESETIKELKITSDEAKTLQAEVSELRNVADARKSEIDALKATWVAEKSVLLELKNEAERKYNEINEQNKILHNRLEAMHIKLAESVRSSSAVSLGTTSSDPQGDDDLQKVIGYLRRSKEIAETEISLLKQEKLRLQSQLESSLKASETAQSVLNAERANSREILYTDEEFRILKLQVTEMNLLRESNMQLREENKHNFEECQKYREMYQKAEMETEHSSGLLREKEIELDACQKEIEMNMTQIKHLEQRISELHERSKNIDVEDYDRMKEDFQQIQVKLEEKEAELDEVRNLVAGKQEYISCLEHDLANSQLELTEAKKKVNDALQIEATLKLDAEKQKKLLSNLKKRVDILTKEKEELIKEKQVISKQMEDLKSTKKPMGETASEQAMKEKEKEKDTRIQMLERTLEREREDLRKEKDDNRKEKLRRQKFEKQVLDLMQRVQQEKKQLLEKLEGHKHHVDDQVEASGTLSAPVPPDPNLDNQTAAYLLAVDNFEEAMHSALNDGLGGHSAESSPLVDASSAGQQVTSVALNAQSPLVSPVASHVKVLEEREKRKTIPKPSIEARKTGRRLVRPRFEQSHVPVGDSEISETEGPTEAKLGSASHELEPQAESSLPPSHLARKRQASLPASELQEESLGRQEAISDLTPLVKRPKGSDSPHGIEEPSLPSENVEKLSEELRDYIGGPANTLNQETVDGAKNEEAGIVKEPMEEPKDTPLEGSNLSEMQYESIDTAEEMEKPRDTGFLDESCKVEDVHDTYQLMEAENEREEGELVPDGTEQPDGDLSNTMDLEIGEIQGELVTGASVSTVDGAVTDAGDPVDIPSPEVLSEEKNETVEIVEEGNDSSDKSNENGQGALDSQQSPQAAFGAGEGSSNLLADAAVSKQGSPSVPAEMEEGRESRTTRSTTTINLHERARERAAQRQAGVGVRVVSPSPTRGRGRAISGLKKNARGGRGGRGGRGPSSGEQV
ncbi:hypothetical protein AAC387_Pa08g1378 [Persea americana]